MHSFKDWIIKQTADSNARGDFIRAVRRDRNFPSYTSRDAVEAYLKENSYWPAELAEFRRLWREFIK